MAVKKVCNIRNLDHKQSDSKVKTLGSINNKNTIKQLCSIFSQDAKLLVYEHMEKGSLDDWLRCCDRKGAPTPLDWPTRLTRLLSIRT